MENTTTGRTYIEFRKERDFNQIFNATFSFIKHEFKPFLRALIYYAGPLILITAILASLFQSKVQDIVTNPSAPEEILFNFFKVFSTKDFILLMVSSVLSQVFIALTAYCYIDLYIKKGIDKFSFEDLWEEIKHNFAPIFITSLLSGILIAFGILLCILPGVYFAICISLIFIMRIYEQNSFSKAFSRCFELIKGEWWSTFGLLLVIYIIVSLINGLVTLPVTILTWLVNFNVLDKAIFGPSSLLYITLYSIFNFLASFISTIPMVTIALQYFSLVEKKEKPGLEKRIMDISPQN